MATASSSSSYSVPLCNKLPHLASDYSLTPIPTTTHFAISSKLKPIQPLKLKPQFRHAPPLSPLFRSLRFSPFAASDNFKTELAETETETETESESELKSEMDQEEQEEDVDDTEKASAEAGRLYVGNLPYSMTSSQLSEIFGEAGRVVSVEIVYDRVTDRSRGFAFVTMGSVEEAKEAIRMFDGSLVGGRTVKVNFPEVPRGGEREVLGPKIRSNNQGFIDSPHKIYAGNLAWSLSSQRLREVFADQPGLLSAKVIFDRDSGRSRGFGFVTFSSAEEVESALSAMNGMEVEGRPLRLNMAEERAPTTPAAQARTPESSFDSPEMVSSIGN